jgi:hypothetical protein
MRSFGRQRFSLGLWVCAVYTLIICASLCIGISQSFLPAAVRRSVKALHVDVVAPWNASSLPLELLEGIRRIYSDRLFWSLLDQIADGTDLLRSANSDSERELSAIRWLRTRLELAWTAAAADRMRRAAPSRAALTADFSSDATQMMSLSGYTVELALKSSDYVVLDTKQNETLWLQRNKTQHVKQRGAAGSVAIDIQDLDKDEIQATLDALLTGASETLEELLMDLTGSLLQGIEQLGNDLPSIGAALWKEAKAEPSFAASVAQSRALLTASAENLSRLHPELHWDNLPSVLFLNGRQVSPDASSVALCAATIAAAHLAAYRIWDMMDPLKTAAIDDRER